MDSEPSATSAANNRHNRYMVIGKKQRYIEVLQCSGEDMSLVLTGGLVPPATPTKSPLISPGMLQLPCPPTLNYPAVASEASQLNPLAYQNLLMQGLLGPTAPGLMNPANPSAQIPGLEFLLQQQQQQSPFMMLPGQAIPRLLPPSMQLQHNPAFLLPPPPIQGVVPRLPAPPPAFSASQPPPPAPQHPAKRSHDQAFQQQLDAVPNKRPAPILYPQVSVAGLLPNPTLPAQHPFSHL